MGGSCLREAGAPASRSRTACLREAGAPASRSRTEGRSLRRRQVGEGRPPPNTPPGDLKSPGSQLSGSKGRPWWGSKRPFGLCGSRGNGPELSALRRTPSSAVGTVFAGILPVTLAAWSALLPPSATSPGRRGAFHQPSSTSALGACTCYRPPFCPHRQGSRGSPRTGGGRLARLSVSLTWISPAGPYSFGPRRRPLAIDPGGRAVRSLGRKKETRSQIGTVPAVRCGGPARRAPFRSVYRPTSPV